MLLSPGSGWQVKMDDCERLGEGSYGCVVKATCRGQPVAVKSQQQVVTPKSRDFLHELEALSSLDHPNIVTFRGEATLRQACGQSLCMCNQSIVTALTLLMSREVPFA